jgi:hypothetical protein
VAGHEVEKIDTDHFTEEGRRPNDKIEPARAPTAPKMQGSSDRGEVEMQELAGDSKRRLFGLPVSWLGWTSTGLALLAMVSVFDRRFTGGFRGVFVIWIIAGAVAVVAVLRKGERSILVWLPLVIGLLATLWAVAELLFPH